MQHIVQLSGEIMETRQQKLKIYLPLVLKLLERSKNTQFEDKWMKFRDLINSTKA